MNLKKFIDEWGFPLIIYVSLTLHAFLLTFPKYPVFDEGHYIPAARDLIALKASNLEHPFFGKVWAAIGILILGDYYLGWRVFYLLIGTLSIVIFYKIALQFMRKEYAVFASTLLAFENLYFTHSNIAVLDVPPIFFSMLGFYLYIKERYLLSSLSYGFALLNKETALLFLPLLFFYHIFTKKKLKISKDTFIKLFLFIIIIFATYTIPLTIYDQIYKPEVYLEGFEKPMKLTNAFEHTLFMIKYASVLTTTSENVTKGNFAWDWIMPTFQPYEPLPYYVARANKTITICKNQTICDEVVYKVDIITWYGLGNMPLWWSIWFVTPILTVKGVRKGFDKIDIFVLLWIACTYLPMLYLSYFPKRIVYPFYFINTVPALALGVPISINYLPFSSKVKKAIFLIFFSFFVYYFIIFFPVKSLAFLEG
jgi:4-amino-4-deoxy-L-arabinose transferase-like glycosyltransferase